jgi:hypothetical protein
MLRGSALYSPVPMNSAAIRIATGLLMVGAGTVARPDIGRAQSASGCDIARRQGRYSPACPHPPAIRPGERQAGTPAHGSGRERVPAGRRNREPSAPGSASRGRTGGRPAPLPEWIMYQIDPDGRIFHYSPASVRRGGATLVVVQWQDASGVAGEPANTQHAVLTLQINCTRKTRIVLAHATYDANMNLTSSTVVPQSDRHESGSGGGLERIVCRR